MLCNLTIEKTYNKQMVLWSDKTMAQKVPKHVADIQ